MKLITISENYKNFLFQAGIKEFEILTQLSDASSRKYFRIESKSQLFILMDSSEEKKSFENFIKITEILRKNNINAPKIYFQDIPHNLLLIEDFGDYSFTKFLVEHPQKERELYFKAIDNLLQVQEIPVAHLDLSAYSTEYFLKEIKLFIEWYLVGLHQIEIKEESYNKFIEIWKKLLHLTELQYPVLVLRDYHADNLHWLPHQNKLGLIDYQDAVIGSGVYDLVSLIEDARREISPVLANDLIEYFIKKSNFNREEFLTSYHILGAQRNCKIIGIFSRLMLRDDKKQYMPLIPRVFKYLINDLQHPVLSEFNAWLDSVINIKECVNE